MMTSSKVDAGVQMSGEFGQQLALPVGIRSDAGFDNFFGSQAPRVVSLLQQALGNVNETLIWVCGPKESGKSHLAAACLKYIESCGSAAMYLGLDELAGQIEWARFFIDDDAGPSVVVLDDLHMWLNNGEAEGALFQMFNQFKISGRQLIVTSDKPPALMHIQLPDLASRLRSAQVLTLHSPNDVEKQDVLVRVAAERGIHIGNEVAAYIIKRSQRNLGQLLQVLEQVEQASLIEKRKVTVPFIKKVLGW
ncbi:MAG: DnaA regulatory inactivator Hda [Oleiphilaceae bacterium]|nr:DnaA regulatory inactivator Hda [Oleiphilaceae bacterium]